MAQPPKRPTSESTRHLRAVGAGLRDLTVEETDLRTRQILMWGHAADCMQSLVDESEKQREAAQEWFARQDAVMLDTRASADSVRRTVLLATVAGLLVHFAIAWAYAQPVPPGVFQAKRDAARIEP